MKFSGPQSSGRLDYAADLRATTRPLPIRDVFSSRRFPHSAIVDCANPWDRRRGFIVRGANRATDKRLDP